MASAVCCIRELRHRPRGGGRGRVEDRGTSTSTMPNIGAARRPAVGRKMGGKREGTGELTKCG